MYGHFSGRQMASQRVKVCRVGDVADGSAKQFEVLEKSVLVAKEGGKFYAINNKCSHYGAPLSKGSYCNGRVRCPWHGAAFSVKTGDIEDYPGFDSLHSFKTEVEDDNVFVTVNQEQLDNHKRQKEMQCDAPASNAKTVVIVGSGAAASTCATVLRECNFKGKIVMVSKDAHPPYDRPKLSKTLTDEVDKILLKPKNFYNDVHIDLQLNAEVTNVTANEKLVECTGGKSFKYDYLVVASGGQPRQLQCHGVELCDSIHYLRTPTDAGKIGAAAANKRVLVIGSSFIGMEVAAALADKATSVTVTAPEQIPFKSIFGDHIGKAIKTLFESKNVAFQLGHGNAKEIRRKENAYEVVLSGGVAIEFDVLVVGIGVIPATKFLNTTPVKMTEQGQVKVNASMQSIDKHIYACGDICVFPLGQPLVDTNNQLVNVQHWQMALKHGRIAALDIARREALVKELADDDTRTVPFFWSMMFGKSIRFAGYSAGFDRLIVSGDVAELKFAAYYIRNEKIVAVATSQMDPVTAHFANIIYNGISVPASEAQKIADDKNTPDADFWERYLRENNVHAKTHL